jgi:hypothetical protein
MCPGVAGVDSPGSKFVGPTSSLDAEIRFRSFLSFFEKLADAGSCELQTAS